MLTRKEKAVMNAVYEKAMQKGKSCILTSKELLGGLNPKLKITETELPTILEYLEYDGYYELVKSEKKEQPVMVITLRQKGEAFPREMIQEKRQLIQRIAISVGCSALGAIVAWIIRSIM